MCRAHQPGDVFARHRVHEFDAECGLLIKFVLRTPIHTTYNEQFGFVFLWEDTGKIRSMVHPRVEAACQASLHDQNTIVTGWAFMQTVGCVSAQINSAKNYRGREARRAGPILP